MEWSWSGVSVNSMGMKLRLRTLIFGLTQVMSFSDSLFKFCKLLIKGILNIVTTELIKLFSIEYLFKYSVRIEI